MKKKIDKILMTMNPNIHSKDKNIKFVKKGLYYHDIPDISIKGYRNCSRRISDWDISDDINDKIILDIGCNMGMMSIECAKKAKFVHGIETSKGYIEISNLLKDFYGLSNVEFLNESFLEHVIKNNKYDTILSLAVHNWLGVSIYDFMILCKNLLTDDGIVIFETHRTKKWQDIENEIKKAGYSTKRIGKYIDNRTTFRCKII